MDLLRVLHDYAEHRWAQRLAVILLLDDVRRAFGSVPHDTLRALLIAAGVDAPLVELILGATEKTKIFIGGARGGCSLP